MPQNEPFTAELPSPEAAPLLPLPASTPAEPLIAPGARFEGTLSFQGEARIDGEFEGRLLGSGRLVLGPAARVVADIDVDELIVGGQLRGQIRARTRVILESTSRVEGGVEAASLQIQPGASLNGRCRAGASPESPDPKGESEASPG